MFMDKNEKNSQKDTKQISVNVFNYYPLELGGGGETFSISLFDALSANYKVTYFSSTDLINIKNLRVDKISFKYIRDEYISYNILKFPKIIFHPFPKIEEVIDSDVTLIFIGKPIPVTFLKSIASRNKKIIFLLHGLTIEKIRFKSFYQLLYSIYQLFEIFYIFIFKKYYIKENFYYQILNNSQKNFLLKLGVKEKQIFKIYNGIYILNYYAKRNDEKFKIIFMARLDPLKGLNLLRKIITKLERENEKVREDLEFVILGNGKDSWIIKLKNSFSNLRYLGYVSGPEKYAELSTSNLMISTSIKEIFSISIIEGLMSGVPVLATDVSGPKEIISQDKNFGDILDFNANLFVSKILEYYDLWHRDKEKYYERRLKIRESSLKLFDIKNAIDGYSNMIKEILEE
jgi:glycosyltransferase involved in cell wall biosynthesis